MENRSKRMRERERETERESVSVCERERERERERETQTFASKRFEWAADGPQLKEKYNEKKNSIPRVQKRFFRKRFFLVLPKKFFFLSVVLFLAFEVTR